MRTFHLVNFTFHQWPPSATTCHQSLGMRNPHCPPTEPFNRRDGDFRDAPRAAQYVGWDTTPERTRRLAGGADSPGVRRLNTPKPAREKRASAIAGSGCEWTCVYACCCVRFVCVSLLCSARACALSARTTELKFLTQSFCAHAVLHQRRRLRERRTNARIPM